MRFGYYTPPSIIPWRRYIFFMIAVAHVSIHTYKSAHKTVVIAVMKGMLSKHVVQLYLRWHSAHSGAVVHARPVQCDREREVETDSKNSPENEKQNFCDIFGVYTNHFVPLRDAVSIHLRRSGRVRSLDSIMCSSAFFPLQVWMLRYEMPELTLTQTTRRDERAFAHRPPCSLLMHYF